MGGNAAPNAILRIENSMGRGGASRLQRANPPSLAQKLKFVTVLSVLLVVTNMIYLKQSLYEGVQDLKASAAHDVKLHVVTEAPSEISNGTAHATVLDSSSPSTETAKITVKSSSKGLEKITALLQESETKPPNTTEEPLLTSSTWSPSPLAQPIEKPNDLSDPFTWALHKASFQRVDNHSALKRGILIPMYDNIVALGLSLMLELRAMDVILPIEVSHCGDLSDRSIQLLKDEDPLVRIYNVCEFAVQAKTWNGEQLFCNDIEHCHERFRSFDIKILSVVYSEFQEMMIMDADTLYFQSPTPLWETKQYVDTGTLFFHDRIWDNTVFLNEMKSGVSPQTTIYEFFMSTFEIAKYRWLPTIARPPGTKDDKGDTTPQPVTLPFEPSEFLLTSNTWNRLSGHEMDSSLVMWNKARQPRATAILTSFLSLNNVMRPPSYGDKECFFIACELAETKYAFADFAVGNIGANKKEYNEPSPTAHRSTALCGDMAQFFPQYPHPIGGGNSKVQDTHDSLLYLNSDNFLRWNPDNQAFFRTIAKPANRYEGSFSERSLDSICAFNVTIVDLTPLERHRFLQRQKFHEIVSNWLK